MTREEAIARIRDHKIIHKMNEPRAIYISEALDMAIKALQQQPCEDAISREDALLALTGEWTELTDEIIHRFIKRIKALPPVNSQPKTGHWIMSDDGLYRPICDNCGAHPWKGYIPTVEEATEVFKYCPNCGAKMFEPEESEGTDADSN